MSAGCFRVDAGSGDRGRVGNLVEYIYGPGNTNSSERVIASGEGAVLGSTPESIAAEMRATADAARARDRRVSVDPFEHYVISFEEGDSPSAGDAQAAVDIALKHLGLEHHQHAWAMHDDTGNLHVHLVVSKIDPETLRAKHIAFPVKQGEQIGARINHALNMPPMPENAWRVDDSGQLVQAQAASRVKQPDALREIIESASTWREFHERTRAIGIEYERKGSGALINGEKASDVDRAASLAALKKRWGEYEAPPGAGPVPSHEPQRKPPAVERAQERAQERALLRERQQVERSGLVEQYQTAKAAIWADRHMPAAVKRSLAAAERATLHERLAAQRAEHAQQRSALRERLERDKPLLPKPQPEQRGVQGDYAAPREQGISGFKAQATGAEVYYYRPDDPAGAASFVDRGSRIELLDKSQGATLAMLQLAHTKWGDKGFRVSGSDAFKQQCVQLAAERGFKLNNPELAEALQRERARLDKERAAMAMIPANPRFAQFEQLAAALPGDTRFRVTLGSYAERPERDHATREVLRGPDGQPRMHAPTLVLRDEHAGSIGRGKGHDALAPAQIAQRMPEIEAKQRGPFYSRVILTPHSDTHHVIHVDDVSAQQLESMKRDGYTPCVVQQTSPDKRNVLISVARDPSLSAAQQDEVAKRLSQSLNQRYGDPEARNAAQPFRFPGFENRKLDASGALKYPDPARPGRACAIRIEHAQRGDCPRAAADAAELAQQVRNERSAQPRERAQAASQAHAAPTPLPGEKTPAQQAFEAHAARLRADAERMGLRRRKDGTLDQSNIDSLAAQRMRVTGWSSEDIAQAVAGSANVIRAEHGDKPKWNPEQYAQLVAGHAERTDVQRFAHQEKFLSQVERAAGVESPAEQEREQQRRREQEQDLQRGLSL